MSKVLLLGTSNQDKVRELQAILKDLDWEVKSLADFPPVAEPVEDGQTFEENALKKAEYYRDAHGVTTVADDSGLEVDALNGAPGVYSARYAGESCSYADNNEKLLDALQEYMWHERTARFVCCAALARLEGEPYIVRGEVEGHISVEPFGTNGFGYDPVFVPEDHDCTFAEMTAEEKHKIS
ncbi:MAG: RdgB/HAM1 family non-canonical purine NTP pyrophosphatase, partial [Candidatus Hydrogenedentes bacterium]|nr:RdgB/HAM1 family non-canonical purine NTP pyrophosphatase [Candidatus Hydrogenedentota bacterium]